MSCRVDLDYFVEASHSKRLFQIFERAFRFGVLLDQQVIQNVLVSLDQPLRVLLSVL